MKSKIFAPIILVAIGLFLLFLLDTGKINYLFFCGIVFFIFCWHQAQSNKISRKAKNILWILFMTFLLAFNFRTNFFNPKNTMFETFQSDSESLVQNMIDAKNDGVKNTGKYGLGWYNKENKTTGGYASQYGLQGKIFQIFSKVRGKHAMCIFATAFVLALLCFLISKKYNKLLAFCFFATFLTSPWIVNFARNLYWVEFTWFIPMLLGLICSLNFKNQKIAFICYGGVFAAVLVKSLCGYEYLSVILLAMISFLLIDFLEAVFVKDSAKAKIFARHILLLGIFAVAGFVLAILLHANLRGSGNILEGLKSIYEGDVLRRTLGGNPENFHPVYKASFDASIKKVIAMYYNFYTEIISGLGGRFFVLLSLAPIAIFINSSLEKKLNLQKVFLYFVFYATCISWFVLGKSHSFIHTHMNYVLWYFGFVEVCFYVIADEIIAQLKLAYKKYFAKEQKL